MNLIEYPDADLMVMDVADSLSSDLKSALLTHDAVTFAVPGGTTPGPLFDVLSALPLDWARVTVLPTDERCVPFESDRSNARLIRERLVQGRAAEATFVTLYDPATDPVAHAASLGETLAAKLPLDVLLLGMGADMHTASLFARTPGLEAALAPTAPPLAYLEPPSQPEPRISLTGPALSGALRTHLVLTGADKRAALEKAQRLQPSAAPVQTILTNSTIHWAP
ncbi:MAG: 6-phosphogluconolactonase [Pseudomonadota bacterium]